MLQTRNYIKELYNYKLSKARTSEDTSTNNLILFKDPLAKGKGGAALLLRLFLFLFLFLFTSLNKFTVSVT